MKQEDKDKLLETLNQMVYLSNKVNTIWASLMEQGKYPIGDCLEHIYLNNQQKEECLKTIRNYGTKRTFIKRPLCKIAVWSESICKKLVKVRPKIL